MRKTTSLLLALAFGALAPLTGHAAERLAVSTTFAQIFEQGSDGQWRGLGVDVLCALAARAGDTIRFQLYPWPRAQAMVERAQADILVGISAVRGWHYGTQFDQARPLLDISELPQLENGAQMLAYGRVDLLASNERNSTRLISSLRLGAALTVLCPDITQLDGYLAFPRDPKFSAVRDRYNTLFAEMVRSGELARLGARNGVLVPSSDIARPAAGCTDKRVP